MEPIDGALQVKRLWLVLLAPMLGACATAPGGSVTGGECKVFERPPYAVLGKTQYDQDVADNFVESGVGGCHWERPAPRPAALDAPVKAHRHAVKPKPKKKPLWLRMLRGMKSAEPTAQPIGLPGAELVKPDLTEVPIAEPAPPAPRSAIDQLLYPNGAE